MYVSQERARPMLISLPPALLSAESRTAGVSAVACVKAAASFSQHYCRCDNTRDYRKTAFNSWIHSTLPVHIIPKIISFYLIFWKMFVPNGKMFCFCSIVDDACKIRRQTGISWIIYLAPTPETVAESRKVQ